MTRRHAPSFAHTSVIILAAALLLAPASLLAQSRPVELGVDILLSRHMDEGVFLLSAPAGGGVINSLLAAPVTGIRIGIPLAAQVSLEPAVSVSLISNADDTNIGLNTAARVMYHFHDDPGRSRPYLAAIGALTLFESSGMSTQFGIGVEAGVTVPITDQVGWRGGGGFYHGFENDDFDARAILYGLFGLSVFLGGSSDGEE